MDNDRPRAVLFDLWGTLVPNRPERRDAVAHLMAVDLAVDTGAFAAAIRASHRERFAGLTGSLAETLRLLAACCGGDPDADAVERAATRRLELTRELLAADAETLATLDAVRAAGWRLGLVSDSSIETPAVWSGCPHSSRFEAAGFSCLVGVRKPRPEIYLHVTRSLGVAPPECVYVGDGDSRELSGAAALGMSVLRLRLASGGASGHYEGDTAFVGPEIAQLEELLSHPFLTAAEPRSTLA
jgi:putative hydrolase of the HAD superfamily